MHASDNQPQSSEEVAHETARRRAEEALRESEQRYRSLTESSAVGIWHVNIDGSTIYLNPTMRDILEVESIEDLRGKPYYAFFTPESMKVAQSQLELRRRGGSSTYEAELISMRGRTFQVLVSGAPILDDEGQLVSLIGTFSDITEWVKAEEERDRFFELSLDMLCIATLSGTFKRVNPAFQKILGISPEDLVSQPLLSYIHPDDQQATQRELEQLATGAPSTYFEHRFRCHDGSYKWLVWTCVPDLPTGLFYGVARDMTERKRAEEQRLSMERNLLETQKLESLGVLAGGIAHDFNNLLVAVLGNADLALLDLPEGSPARAIIEQIQLAAKRAADLTQQMLAYAGKGRFAVQQISLNAVIEETASLLNTAVAKRAALECRLSEHLPAIEADSTQIRQVVMNLIMNASEAIGEQNGRITLSTGTLWANRDYLAKSYLGADLLEGEYVSLEVQDSGVGMDQETLSKIFNPFFTTKFTGRGLGLAAVLGIVRRHRGALRVISHPGQGTTFTVLFPRAGNSLPVQPPREAPPVRRSWGSVLIVDDEEHVRMVTARMLQRFGFQVLLAANGREALRLVHANDTKIDCILLDMTMPQMSGEEALKQIRAISPKARIILMSGYSEEDVTTRFAGLNLAGFLQKPFSARDLQEKIVAAIGAADNPGTERALE